MGAISFTKGKMAYFKKYLAGSEFNFYSVLSNCFSSGNTIWISVAILCLCPKNKESNKNHLSYKNIMTKMRDPEIFNVLEKHLSFKKKIIELGQCI